MLCKEEIYSILPPQASFIFLNWLHAMHENDGWASPMECVMQPIIMLPFLVNSRWLLLSDDSTFLMSAERGIS